MQADTRPQRGERAGGAKRSNGEDISAAAVFQHQDMYTIGRTITCNLYRYIAFRLHSYPRLFRRLRLSRWRLLYALGPITSGDHFSRGNFRFPLSFVQLRPGRYD